MPNDQGVWGEVRLLPGDEQQLYEVGVTRRGDTRPSPPLGPRFISFLFPSSKLQGPLNIFEPLIIELVQGFQEIVAIYDPVAAVTVYKEAGRPRSHDRSATNSRILFMWIIVGLFQKILKDGAFFVLICPSSPPPLPHRCRGVETATSTGRQTGVAHSVWLSALFSYLGNGHL
ncbi:hypothetical protein JOB18_042816 [Solea senegalensis]|uniref:Uncharacterized protein n=1 Tax=Solea senegalensis TaxID=28829 RepID=A0AAV6QYN5_SOLSE|nr:hypothetical protein JOB18_042816 [Solea senegalensis]